MTNKLQWMKRHILHPGTFLNPYINQSAFLLSLFRHGNRTRTFSWKMGAPTQELLLPLLFKGATRHSECNRATNLQRWKLISRGHAIHQTPTRRHKNQRQWDHHLRDGENHRKYMLVYKNNDLLCTCISVKFTFIFPAAPLNFHGALRISWVTMTDMY